MMPIAFPALFFLISLIALIIATYTDLKERIVPNKLTFSLIFGGLLLQSIRSLLANDPSIIIVTGAVTFAAAVGSLLMHKAGAWAGGDVKLMTGLATINTVNHGVLRDLIGVGGINLFGIEFSFASISEPIFPLTLLIFSIFSMLPYGTAVTLKNLIKKKELIRKMNLGGKLLRLVRKKFVGVIITSAAVVGLAVTMTFFGVSEIFQFPFLILIGLLGITKMTGLVQNFLAVILFAFAFYLSVINALYNLMVVFVIILLITLAIEIFIIRFRYAKGLLSKIFSSEKLVENLKEGEIPVKTIIERNGKIEVLEGSSIGKLIKHLMDNNLDALNQAVKSGGRVIASSASAAGLTKEQLEEVKELAKKGLIPKRIEVKETTAFVPAILIGYLLLQLVGDVIWAFYL